MHYAILAAGEGSRLIQEGETTPKPLVRVNGEPIIDRLIRIFVQNNAQSITIITNSAYPQLKQYIDSLNVGVRVILVDKATPSSMHSFFEISSYLTENFCMTTVDTIFNEKEFAAYINKFESEGKPLMGVTDYIDDEKPLYVGVDNNKKIVGFYDNPTPPTKYISGGIYSLTPACIPVLHNCMANGVSKMRNYQRQLIDSGIELEAYVFTKVIDIDHITDISKAEQLIKGGDE